MLRTFVKNYTRFNDSIAVVIKRNAGHSKWANIKHTKGEKDAERSRLFTKLASYMKVAVKEGGSADPKKNLKLEQLIEQAKKKNMPVATIQSILKSAQMNKSDSKCYMMDIKGPGGCVILCEVFTDNLMGVKQVMTAILKKHSSKYGDGGIKHLFESKGKIETTIPENYPKKDEEIVEEATSIAIEVGAEDVSLKEDCLEFICAPELLPRVQTSLEKVNHKVLGTSVDYTPIKLQTLSDSDLDLCSSLYKKLEQLPEVTNLYDNIA